MTVHLACSSRGETSAKYVTESSQRNSHPRCCSRHGTSVLYYASVPLAANFRCRRTQLWTTVNQAGRCRYAEGSQPMPQDCRAAIAWRRSSWQLTVRDADPTNVCPFTTWYYTRYWVWNFEKVFKHSTHRAHKNWTVPLLLVTSTVLVVSVIYYCVHSQLGTLLKCCCIKKQSQTTTTATPRVAPH